MHALCCLFQVRTSVVLSVWPTKTSAGSYWHQKALPFVMCILVSLFLCDERLGKRHWSSYISIHVIVLYKYLQDSNSPKRRGKWYRSPSALFGSIFPPIHAAISCDGAPTRTRRCAATAHVVAEGAPNWDSPGRWRTEAVLRQQRQQRQRRRRPK